MSAGEEIDLELAHRRAVPTVSPRAAYAAQRHYWLNLLSNACKFTKEGEVALRVRKMADGRDWVELAVADSRALVRWAPSAIHLLHLSLTNAERRRRVYFVP